MLIDILTVNPCLIEEQAVSFNEFSIPGVTWVGMYQELWKEFYVDVKPSISCFS